MNSIYFSLKQGLFHFLYTRILKRVLFLNDPESVHDNMVKIGISLGKYKPLRIVTALAFDYKHSMLEQNILGIHFVNPVGLSAGFDKNAELTDILPSIGFGFEEVGSITGEPCDGNPKPRLWRLKKSKSLLVNYGLKNEGASVLSEKLSLKTFKVPVGISIAKTNSHETCDPAIGVEDYVKVYKAFKNIGDYYIINISCPNTFGGQPFTDCSLLEMLLSEIDLLPKTKPVFIKLSPDLLMAQIDDILNVVSKHSIDGFVVSNLTKNRQNSKLIDSNIPVVGGFSGKVVEDLSNDLIKYIYSKYKEKYVIIGVGGVFSADDAFKKIKSGASLIQIITGMVFEGPQVIGNINHGLVKLLKKNGYHNISEAVGADL